MSKAFQLGLTILIGTILMTGCGPPEEGLELKLYFSPLRSNDPLPPGEPPPDITDFRLCVSAADMSKPKCKQFNLTDYQKRKKARFDDLPVGTKRKVTFQGYDYADLEVHWCGEVHDIEIKKDSTTKVTMFITACSDFTGVRNQMGAPRVFHTATKLSDGRVLIAGGFFVAAADADGERVHLTATDSVDIYDPLTGSFDSESGILLNHARGLHTATPLPDGRIFIAGGCEKAIWRVDFPDFRTDPKPVIVVDEGGWGTAGSVAEIIHPTTGLVEAIEDPLPTSRAYHGDMLLPNGDVLLLGGMGPNASQALSSTARYVASDGTFLEISNAMAVSRHGMLMVPLGGARSTTQLVWGGNHPPAAGAGTFAESLKVENNEVLLQIPQFVDISASEGLPSFYSAGVQLQSGEVLVTGGMLTDLAKDPNLLEPRVLQQYRLLDMGNETIVGPTNPSNTMGHLFAFHTATLLRSNKVLITGGVTSVPSLNWFCDPQKKAVFYYPWEEEESAFVQEQISPNTVTLSIPRAGHTATELDDGTILLVGGFTGAGAVVITDTAEIFNPAPRVLRIE